MRKQFQRGTKWLPRFSLQVFCIFNLWKRFRFFISLLQYKRKPKFQNMKKNLLYFALAAMPFVFACNQSQKKTDTSKKDSLVNQTCYAAFFEKDSAAMIVKTMASGKITGSLLVKYADKPENNGKISGKFNGDTLLVDYRFNTGKDTTKAFTNPLAFLKKNGKLIMGVAQIETTLGRSYFVKGKPINYEAGKFTFSEVDCK